MRGKATATFSRKLATLTTIMRGCRAAGNQYATPPWRVWPRFLGLYGRRFSPREIFLWGLLDPDLGVEDLQGYVSKENLLRFQRRYNPAGYANLVEDKSVFYPLCEGVGLPTPRLLALFSGPSAWLADRGCFVASSGLLNQVNRQSWDAFVMKPDKGVYGRGVYMVTSAGDGNWVDQSGDVFSENGFERYCNSYPGYCRYLLQERLHNHPEISALTGVTTLQTVRVITVSAGDGRPGEVVLANWRIAGDDSITDNFDYGRGGNLLAEIDVVSGCVRRAVGPVPEHQGVCAIGEHPRTGAALTGFRLPHWQEVREVVLAGTAHFAPLRLLGWDIAITQRGPVLIEANAWFDAGQNAFGNLPTLVERTKRINPGSKQNG